MHFHSRNLILKIDNFVTHYPRVNVLLFGFFLQSEDHSGVFIDFILFLINLGLKMIQLLKCALVLFSSEKRFLHDVFEFNLETIPVFLSICNSLPDLLIGHGRCLQHSFGVFQFTTFILGSFKLLEEGIFVRLARIEDFISDFEVSFDVFKSWTRLNYSVLNFNPFFGKSFYTDVAVWKSSHFFLLRCQI